MPNSLIHLWTAEYRDILALLQRLHRLHARLNRRAARARTPQPATGFLQ
ncbi:MAG: hypothetical protein WC953_09975 [Pseudomonas sp.]